VHVQFKIAQVSPRHSLTTHPSRGTQKRAEYKYCDMVRSAQLIQKTVFLSVNNPLTPMSEIQTWVEVMCALDTASNITGVVMAGSDRWVCLLEGLQYQVEAITQAIRLNIRPRQWHVLMTDARARVRMFPNSAVGWRNGCNMLEMAAFLSDLRRHTSPTQHWHTDANALSALLEPKD
jgi:Sensors of blue-light using FAD